MIPPHQPDAAEWEAQAATLCGNLTLVDTLLARGGGRSAQDMFGRTALHLALLEAQTNPCAANSLNDLFQWLAAPLELMADGRMLRLEPDEPEYLVFQTMFALFLPRWQRPGPHAKEPSAWKATMLMEAIQHYPAAMRPLSLDRRQGFNLLLSTHERASGKPQCRFLFQRVAAGRYELNTNLALRRDTAGGPIWQPLPQALNLPLLAETALPAFRPALNRFRVEHPNHDQPNKDTPWRTS